MAEPTTATFIGAGAATALLGPVLGPYTMIVFGAVAGSMLAMGRASTDQYDGSAWYAKYLEAARFVLVGVLMATAITGFVAYLLEKYFEIPSSIALMPVAAAIGVGRNALLGLIDALFTRLAALIGTAGAPK